MPTSGPPPVIKRELDELKVSWSQSSVTCQCGQCTLLNFPWNREALRYWRAVDELAAANATKEAPSAPEAKKPPRSKAGVIVTNADESMVLIVQSYENYVGFPKGSVESSDLTLADAASRELEEEAGVVVKPQDFDTSKPNINLFETQYFRLTRNSSEVIRDIKTKAYQDDVSLVGWIRFECLQDLLQRKVFRANQQCIAVLRMLGK